MVGWLEFNVPFQHKSAGPPGIPVLKVKNSPTLPALGIPENSRCQKHYIFVYLSILDLYWRCNLYVYLGTAAVVEYLYIKRGKVSVAYVGLRSSVTVGVTSSVANGVTMRMTS